MFCFFSTLTVGVGIFTLGGEFSGLFTGHDLTRGSGQRGFKISRVGSGRVARGTAW